MSEAEEPVKVTADQLGVKEGCGIMHARPCYVGGSHKLPVRSLDLSLTPGQNPKLTVYVPTRQGGV